MQSERVNDNGCIKYFPPVSNVWPNVISGENKFQFSIGLWTELCLPMLPLAAVNDDILLKF